jgi:hypothetical protein
MFFWKLFNSGSFFSVSGTCNSFNVQPWGEHFSTFHTNSSLIEHKTQVPIPQVELSVLPHNGGFYNGGVTKRILLLQAFHSQEN